ncbi:MAG: tetratricopeptide repeat protein [Bauldia sp.]|nr:tetratricopeptide repeat protein [Bauldia sp.]
MTFAPSSPSPGQAVASTGPAPGPRRVRIFISSPADAQFERMRVDRVVERLNGAFADLARLETVRWEREFYKAHETFQAQIPEAADCDIVIAVLRHRLGTELPTDFPRMPDGEPYPSGTAYEILTAMDAAGQKGLPDIYVFRYPEPPVVKLDDAETNELITEQWNRLKGFFARWFRTPEGHFKASYHEFRSTDEFEQQVEALLRKWLEERILKGRSVVWPIETKGSPFRGLSSFGARHAAVFFGRGRDIARSVDLIKEAAARGTAFLLLVGASGSGKSSLARAGIVPRLTTPGVVPGVDRWRVALFRPGEVRGDPAAGLAARLFEGAGAAGGDDAGRPAALPELATGDYATPESLAVLMAHGDETAPKPIIAALDKVAAAEQRSGGHARPLRADLVLVVDQIDNLFTASVTPEQRQRFAALLAVFAATGRVWIVATLRADLYERFLKEPRLFDLKTTGAAYDLQPPGPAGLAEIVRGPAAAADLDFDTDPANGRTLDEALLADADRPDMLPLLQFTLDQLFERREVRDGRTRLTFAAYQAIGGMGGAIDRQAEAAFAALGPEEQARLPRLLRQLAEPDHDGGSAPLAIRAIPLSEASLDEASARLVDALVEARVILSSADSGETHIRLAHQRVLESWDRARTIIAENAAFFRIREDIEDQRRRWEAGGRRTDLFIPSGLPLAEAESVSRKFGTELPPGALAYVTASSRRARARIRLLIAATAIFAVIAAVAVWQTFAAESRRREAAAERDRAEQNFVLAEQRRVEAEAERERAEQNFAAAKTAVENLAFDVMQGIAGVAGVRLSDIAPIIDMTRRTLDQLAATAPADLDIGFARVTTFVQLAETLQAQGDLAAGVKAMRDAVAGARELVAATDGDLLARRVLGVALSNLSAAYIRAGNYIDAEPPLIEALDIVRPVVSEYGDQPGVEPFRADLVALLDRLGSTRLARGDGEGALAAFEESLAESRVLVASQPTETTYSRNLVVALSKVADIYRALGNMSASLALFDEALARITALSAADPTNAQWLRDRVATLNQVSAARLLADDVAGATTAADEGVGLARTLVSYDAANTDYQRSLAVALNRSGDVRFAAGGYAEAFALFDESVTVVRALLERDATNRLWRDDLVVGLDRAAAAMGLGGDIEGAIAGFEEAHRVAAALATEAPDDPRSQSTLLTAIYKIALWASGDRAAEAGAEGTALIERLQAEGRLSDPEVAYWQSLFAGLGEPAPTAGALP